MKKKRLVLIGIAICAILLASPMLASAGYSKIYGNANEDDVLDMRDVTYIKLVIFGKKPDTTFADANNDGKISMLDIGQTKLIILGKEKKLTLVDQADRTVTINKPVERVASLVPGVTRVVIPVAGGIDNIVGVSNFVPTLGRANFIYVQAYPELLELPGIGWSGQENMELIVSIKPDVVFVTSEHADTIQGITGIPTVSVSVNTWYEGDGGIFESYSLVGKVMGKEEGAEELISFVNDELDKVRAVTSDIPEPDKPKVYFTHMYLASDITRAVTAYDPLDIAGGINVAAEFKPAWISSVVDISKEQIVKWNPDIILIHGSGKTHELSIENTLNDPVLQTVNAVKNKRIYYTRGWYVYWDPTSGVTEAFYLAKLFHPDKFADFDVEKEGNEIMERFYGADGLYTWLLDNSDFYRWD